MTVYLAVDNSLGHSQHDGVAHCAHVGSCVLCKLLQEAVKSTSILSIKQPIACRLRSNFAVLLEEHS